MDFWSVQIFETLLIQAVVRWDLLLRDERLLQRSVREARAGGHVTPILLETWGERTQEGTGEILRAGPGALESQCPNGIRRLTECLTWGCPNGASRRRKGRESPSAAGSQAAPFPTSPMFKGKTGKKFFCFILKWSYIAQAGLECIILLPQLREYRDDTHHHCHMKLYFSETVTYFPQADLPALSPVVVSHQNI